MSYLFDEAYYVACKLAQLKSAQEKDPRTGEDYTQEGLYRAFAEAGLTPREHYETYGRFEELNPNPYFNEYEYLEAKARQLNSVGNQPNPEGGPWDAKAVLKAIIDAGFTPAEHYEIYGAFERDAQGNFINPSNAFDANAYWSAKLLQLQTEEADRGWTMATMLEAFQEVGVSPVSHYQLWGADEANAGGIPFVQTVPVSQRVPNDPARDEVTGDVAPGNYMNATPPPTDDNAAPAHNPCDVGGLADTSVSPPPAHPDHSLPVPGDQDYLPPPSTIRPGPDVVILPPSGEGDTVSDHWLVVDRNTGKVIVVDRDGSILGQVDGTVADDGDGGQTITLPPSSNVPVSTLPPLDPESLPPFIEYDPDKPGNNFPPPPDYSGITALASTGRLVLGGSIHSSGASSVTLADDGTVSAWSGQRAGVNKPASGLDTGGVLDASAVTGSGRLTLDVSAVTAAHSVKGSATANNEVRLGASATGYTGGDGKDDVTIKGNGENVAADIDLGKGVNSLIVDKVKFTGALSHGGGNNTITVTNGGSIAGVDFADAALAQTVTVDGGTVTGSLATGSGDDVMTITNNGFVEGSIELGAGDDTLTVDGGAVENRLSLGGGDDHVIIENNASVGGSISLGAGNNSLTVDNATYLDALEDCTGGNTILLTNGGSVGGVSFAAATLAQTVTVDGGTVTGILKTGSGNDTVTIKNNGTVGLDIDLGAGDDTLTISGEHSSVKNINLGAGNDILTISDKGAVDGNIDLGAGDDTLTINGTVSGEIAGEEGADHIALGNSGQVLLNQGLGHSGTFGDAFNAAPDDSKVSTAELDVISAVNWGTVQLKTNLSNGNTWNLPAGDLASSKLQSSYTDDNKAYLVRGKYDAETGVFTDGFGESGTAVADALLIYDSLDSTDVRYEAVVLVGLNDLPAALDDQGLIVFQAPPAA